jgi:hypothetical protein
MHYSLHSLPPFQLALRQLAFPANLNMYHLYSKRISSVISTLYSILAGSIQSDTDRPYYVIASEIN